MPWVMIKSCIYIYIYITVCPRSIYYVHLEIINFCSLSGLLWSYVCHFLLAVWFYGTKKDWDFLIRYGFVSGVLITVYVHLATENDNKRVNLKCKDINQGVMKDHFTDRKNKSFSIWTFCLFTAQYKKHKQW